MFEAVELGRRVTKAEYEEREPALHTRLLTLQLQLRAAKVPVVIIVSGVEGAGKGTVVNRLNEWLDTRSLETWQFFDDTEEQRERPYFWRFWRVLPARGTVAVMFGSWYTYPIIDRAIGGGGDRAFEKSLARIADFERMLTADGAVIIKLWYHLSEKAQRTRLKADEKAGRKGIGVSLTRKYAKRYADFASVSETAIRLTDTGSCPWYVIDAADRRSRDLTTGMILAKAFEKRLDHVAAEAVPAPVEPVTPSRWSTTTVLDLVDLGATVTDDEYRRGLRRYQNQLGRLTWQARQAGRNTVVVFEGWDAAGKGGAIRRMTAAMDARNFRVISVGAPTDEELAHHYLWRFWRHIPRAGRVTIYDRSWHGRVLVERVEGFAREDQWMRAYGEINEFEDQLASHGVVLVKFWIHLSPDEQLRRFKERQQIPWKRHKITDEDWRNRDKWDAYAAAVDDMVGKTSTKAAPWLLIPGDDKHYARLEVLKATCQRLKKALN